MPPVLPPNPDQPYLPSLAGVTFQPIFIMGDHRTGTTLLYKLLAATDCFNVLTAYHVIQYDQILYNAAHHQEDQARQALAAELSALSVGDRAIDQVLATPDLPEEYGFILQRFSGEPYLTLKTKPIFVELCQKIQQISTPNRPLLLKNPWDFRQFMAVYQAFPDALFIFMHRHPLYSLSSKVKALRVLLSVENPYMALLLPWYARFFKSRLQQGLYRLLYTKTLGLDFSQVARQAVKTTTYFVENIPKLPTDQYLSVQYEDLCQKPEAAMGQILEFLGLQSTQASRIYSSLIQPRPHVLVPEVKQRHIKLCQALAPYMTFHHYPPLTAEELGSLE